MNIRLQRAGRSVAVAAVTACLLAATATVAQAESLPPAIQALQRQGITIIGSFPSKTGLQAYAAMADGRPAALYVTPQGDVIAGTALDAGGLALDAAALDAAVRKPLTEASWKQLEASSWIADGKDGAPRIVYVFTDPNCPFCAKLWLDARPWVEAGKVQLRHVLVGILTPTSAGKAAALLTAKDPAEALRSYEGAHAPAAAKAMGAGARPRPLADGPLQPLRVVPPPVAAQLDAHARLMASLGMQATPALVWRDAKGAIQKRSGAPDAVLAEILGPK